MLLRLDTGDLANLSKTKHVIERCSLNSVGRLFIMSTKAALWPVIHNLVAVEIYLQNFSVRGSHAQQVLSIAAASSGNSPMVRNTPYATRSISGASVRLWSAACSACRYNGRSSPSMMQGM